MVSLDGRLAEIRRMIDRKYYFSINRGRQYGKTTTLAALKHFLRADFIVASLDFQFLSPGIKKPYAQQLCFRTTTSPQEAGSSLIISPTAGT